MSEKHVLVCDQCGKEDGDLSDTFTKGRSVDRLPAGWFIVAGQADNPIEGVASHFCSNNCVANYFADRSVTV